MRKKITMAFAVAVLAAPLYVAADTNAQTQLITLYQQLVQLLQQEIGILRENTLTMSPQSGAAPFTATFTLNKVQGNEAIDFGDGHSTGSGGCAKNSQGFCDLSKPLTHTYQLPGTYTVSLLRTTGSGVQTVASWSVKVTQ